MDEGGPVGEDAGSRAQTDPISSPEVTPQAEATASSGHDPRRRVVEVVSPDTNRMHSFAGDQISLAGRAPTVPTCREQILAAWRLFHVSLAMLPFTLVTSTPIWRILALGTPKRPSSRPCSG